MLMVASTVFQVLDVDVFYSQVGFSEHYFYFELLKDQL